MKEVRHYCRACKSITIENFIDMESEHLGTSYRILYFECTGISIENDDFSKILCQTCVRALVFVHEFTQMCKKTQKELECSHPLSMLRTDETELLESMVKPMMDKMSLKEMVEDSDFVYIEKQKEEKNKVFDEGTNVLSCDICRGKYSSFSQIRKHMKEIHKERKCNICETFFQGSISYKTHLESFHDGPTSSSIICAVCNKAFSTVSVLNRHTRTVHENIRQFSCHLCDKSFKHKTHLLAHQSVHVKDRQYNCGICSLSFKTEAVLIKHFKTHTALPNHICDICGSKFKSTTYLKIHKDTHAITKVFSCKICRKLFKTIRTLRDHERTHKETEPLDCHVCGKKLKNNLTLKNHLRDHFTPGVACLECGRSFSNKHVLKDHIAAQHENVRSFVCQFEGCGHAYFTSSHLNYHVKAVHLGMQVRKNKS